MGSLTNHRDTRFYMRTNHLSNVKKPLVPKRTEERGRRVDGHGLTHQMGWSGQPQEGKAVSLIESS